MPKTSTIITKQHLAARQGSAPKPLPRLLIAIIANDGQSSYLTDIKDPREGFCRQFNALNVGATAVPVFDKPAKP